MEKQCIEITKEEFHLINKFYSPFKRADLLNTNNFIIDWNNLMPVVEKIKSMCPKLYSPLEGLKDKHHPFNIYAKVLSLPISTEIDQLYKRIIEFIKWHNNQPN